MLHEILNRESETEMCAATSVCNGCRRTGIKELNLIECHPFGLTQRTLHQCIISLAVGKLDAQVNEGTGIGQHGLVCK